MAEQVTAYIGLGSNLGDRDKTLRRALDRLDRIESIAVLRTSDAKESPPLGGLIQPSYLNAVAEIQTTLPPEVLLSKLHTVETSLGRERHGTWSSRTLDLDLLCYGDVVITGPDLIVPHPQMHLRTFVLEGLCQLNPGLVHPLLKETMCELARRLGGANIALDPHVPQLVAIAGLIGVGKTTLAKRLATVLEAEVLFEPYDTNPYMPEVYAGRSELALDSQLYFLTRRAEQLDPAALASRAVFLTDYVFEKELIYARRLLSAQQLDLYERIYRPFSERVAAPVLVLYLQDAPERCLQRIHGRNRPYEQRITVEFLDALHVDYERLFATWTACPVIRVPASDLSDDDDAILRHLAVQVKAYVTARAYSAVK